MIISAPRLLRNGIFTGPGAVAVENGLITAIFPEIPSKVDLALPHGTLTPGLIDIHNNGAFGVDFATATMADWAQIIQRLAACGVTSVLPAIITAPLPALQQAASGVAAAMATHGAILGLHIEGPFLAPAQRGAHQEKWLALPNAASLLTCPALKLVTLAPELPGALAAIRQLVAANVTVALGHTNASAAQMQEAAQAGARLVTHVFNAQAPLHHRAPGPAGAALTHPLLHPCAIADGLHLDPLILQLIFAACPRAIAVTDSILLAGLAPGARAEFGGATATLAPEGVARRENGTISGAAITLNEAVQRLISFGIPAEIALSAATSRPADALSLTDRGHLAPGQRADLIWWNNDFSIRQVWTPNAPPQPSHTPARAISAPAPAPGTETVRENLNNLESRSSFAIVNLFLAQEQAAQTALTACAEPLSRLADATVTRMEAGGRLFYAGAGTSGRLALLDAAECGPTFGIPDGLIIPLLAGGPQAFLRAAEGAEDNAQAAIAALTAHNFSKADTLIGIAASGATPFTLAAIKHAASLGALTGAITNNPGSPIASAAHIAVAINSGAEIIAGSTRLSAGTTQKIALNILSSTIMIKSGKTYGPYMVDLQATNAKLRARAVRITAAIANVSTATATTALAACAGDVKTAILTLRLHLTPAQARTRLQQAGGHLNVALKQ